MEEVQVIRSHQAGKTMEKEMIRDERENKRDRERNAQGAPAVPANTK